MSRQVASLIAGTLLVAGVAPRAAASDPTDAHRWHLPRRGARDLAQDVVGPAHADWNRLGLAFNAGKEVLGDWGIRFDLDVDFFEQHASRVADGQHNFGTFYWRSQGDWQLVELAGGDRLSALGKGFVAWNAFGTVGLDYDPDRVALTGNVRAVNPLNGTVFADGAVVDELFWKQVALDGKLVVLAGKVDMLSHFDTNQVANDAATEFFAYALQNNPTIPAPTYGGFGGLIRVNASEAAYLMVGAADSSIDTGVLPWKTLDNDSWYELVELGWSPHVPGLGQGSYRLTSWHDHLFGSDGVGVGLSIDQALGAGGLVAFFRLGYGDKDVAPVKLFFSGGLGFEAPFGRKHDLVAIGVAWSDPGVDGGFRDQTLVELFYRVEIAESISLSPDLELVFDPASNRRYDFIAVPGIRLLLEF